MKYLLRNIRFYVLLFSISLSMFLYLYSSDVFELTRHYALIAAGFLYLTLLAGPLCYTFKFLPFRMQYIKARRAIGVSTFYFGLLHAYFAFFGEFGGLAGIVNLPLKYTAAVSFGLLSLIILTLMALTANDFMIEKLTFPKWKFLHRFIYVVGVFILIHAFLIGSHFQNLPNMISITVLSAVIFLLFLEIPRVVKYFKSKR